MSAPVGPYSQFVADIEAGMPGEEANANLQAALAQQSRERAARATAWVDARIDQRLRELGLIPAAVTEGGSDVSLG